MRRLIAVLAAVAVALSLAVVIDARAAGDVAPQVPVQVTRAVPPYQDVEWFDVTRADDVGKAGVNRSVIVQRMLTIDAHTCGVSGDQLRVRFDQPAEVTGVDISVDIGGPLELVEVMAAANGTDGYEPEGNRQADPLAHTSWIAEPGSGRFIDKATVLPAPVGVHAGGFVTIGAWLCGGVGVPRVSPEVVVHYRWITA